MIKKFRPLWNLDVDNMEKWLSRMATRGYHLEKINFITRVFVFAEGTPREATYRFVYDGTPEGPLSRSLVNHGWRQACQHKKWYLLFNPAPENKIRVFPARDDVLRHTRVIMYVLGAITLLYAFTSFVPLLLISLAMGNLLSLLHPTNVIIYALIIYLWIKLIGSQRRMFAQQGDLNRKIATGAPPPGKPIIKWKLGWQYSPDKLEQWLENMELQGYHLYRISGLGLRFWFSRGIPRRVKYCVDFQLSPSPGYFHIHRETGWKLLFTSRGFDRWSIWSKEYPEGEKPPRLYSDGAHLLKHARRIAVTHTLLFAPLLVLFAINLNLNLHGLPDRGTDGLFLFNTILFCLVLASFGSIIIRIWLYYRRQKVSAGK